MKLREMTLPAAVAAADTGRLLRCGARVEPTPQGRMPLTGSSLRDLVGPVSPPPPSGRGREALRGEGRAGHIRPGHTMRGGR